MNLDRCQKLDPAGAALIPEPATSVPPLPPPAGGRHRQRLRWLARALDVPEELVDEDTQNHYGMWL